MAPGSILSKGSLVGRGSTVEAGARLDRCAVGSDCHIGRGAVLQNSCLHAHVRIDDGCQAASALLADHVVVRSHAKLEVRFLQLAMCTLLGNTPSASIAFFTCATLCILLLYRQALCSVSVLWSTLRTQFQREQWCPSSSSLQTAAPAVTMKPTGQAQVRSWALQ